MQRILHFWSLASVLLGSSIALAQEELQPSQSDAPAAQRLPRIITSAEAAARGPAPKVYRFDISRSSRGPQPLSMPLAPATADSQVRPAAALISGTREMVRLEDESSLIRREPPKSPLDDPRTLPERAYEVPPPAEYVPPPWSGGEGCLGGIPTFTHDYCPLYWDDPWRNYCCERTRGHCQWPRFSLSGITGFLGNSRKSAPPCCESAVPCCDSCSTAPEASRTREPTVVPEIESSPSDRPPSPPKDPPAKRRLPRNEIPQRTNGDTESGI